jgi:hypothetical protein
MDHFRTVMAVIYHDFGYVSHRYLKLNGAREASTYLKGTEQRGKRKGTNIDSRLDGVI